MQLSTRGRYAVMAMTDLGRLGPGSTVALGIIADRQRISQPYLEQLFQKLRRAGLVTGVRGPGGGYVLARDAQEITIAEIMAAVDEPVKMTRCAGEKTGGCIGDDRCLTHDLWNELGERIITFLDGVTLGDVVDNALAKKALLSVETGGVPRGDGTAERVGEP